MKGARLRASCPGWLIFDFLCKPVAVVAASLLLRAAVLHAQTPLAFTNVTLIDGTGAPPRRYVTVLVAEDRIVKIGPTSTTALPADTHVIDGSGKVLIPGLWDMHVHLSAQGDETPEVFIAFGVTGVRDMGGNLAVIQRWRKRIRNGTLPGPRIVAPGPILDGPPARGARGRRAVATAAEGIQAVRELKEGGADFIKTHSLLPRDAYFAIAAAAKAHGLDVCGHVPDAVRIDEAVAAGQKTIEHLVGVALACSTREAQLRRRLLAEDAALSSTDASLQAYVDARLRVDSAALRSYGRVKAAALFRRLAQRGVWQCPTLVTFRAAALAAPSPAGDQRVDYLGHAAQPAGRDAPHAEQATGQTVGERQRAFAQALALVGALHRAGAQFLTGTDLGYQDILPGLSVHEEMALLVQAGLTPLEALQAATRNAARVLGLEGSVGTIAPGKAADLVLLDADPLRDIHNTTRIRAVVVNGQLFDRAALDALLADAAARAK